MNPNLHVEPRGVLEPLLLGGSDLGKIGVHARVEGVLLIQGNAVRVILKLRGPDGFGGCLGTNIPTHSGSRDPCPQAWSSLLPAPVRLWARRSGIQGAPYELEARLLFKKVWIFDSFEAYPPLPSGSSGFSRGRQLLMKWLTGDTITKCCGHPSIPKTLLGVRVGLLGSSPVAQS